MGTIGLVFDLGSSYQSRGNFNHDPGVECLEEACVALLSELIESMGHRCVGIPSTQQLAALASAKIPNLLDGFVNYGTGYDQGHRYVHTAVLLEMIGAPYAGNDPMVMGLCRDKQKTRNLMERAGVLVPAGLFVTEQTRHLIPEISEKILPALIKPNNEGGSLGVVGEIFHTKSALKIAANRLLEVFPEGVLIERYIPGPEITVTLIGNEPDIQIFPLVMTAQSQPVGEDFIYDYDTKMNNLNAVTYMWEPMEFHFDNRMVELVRSASSMVTKTLGLRDFFRIDFRLNAHGILYLLECNSQPAIETGNTYLEIINNHYFESPHGAQKAFLQKAFMRMGI